MFTRRGTKPKTHSNAISRAAGQLADQMDVKSRCTFTSQATPYAPLSYLHPIKLVLVSPDRAGLGLVGTDRSIRPVLGQTVDHTRTMAAPVDRSLIEVEPPNDGDLVVITVAPPPGKTDPPTL